MAKDNSIAMRFLKQIVKFLAISILGEDRYWLNRYPFNMPLKARFEHLHVMAASGHGKSQLLTQWIYRDLKATLRGKGGLCLIDSQGDMIRTIRELEIFSPSLKKSLADKLVIIDPNDIEYPVSLNMFDMHQDDLGNIEDKALRESLKNSTLSLYEYIFSDLVGGELTLYQKNIYIFCSDLLMRIPGANLQTFLDLLREPEKFRADFSKLDPLGKRFFIEEFNSKKYSATKDQIATRLWGILSHTTFQRILTGGKNKIDMFKMMNDGKVILINTSKALLQEERCRMLGKFFIGLILQSTFRRAVIPENFRKPFWLYIDEVQDYLGHESNMLMNFLAQGRKYRVGTIFSHQYLDQLSQVSTSTKSGVLANTGIKIYGRVEHGDADFLSRRVGLPSDSLTSLKKVEGKFAEFVCTTKSGVAKAFQIPLGFINRKRKMSKDDQEKLIAMNRDKYCEPKASPTIGQLNLKQHLKTVPEDLEL